MGVYCSVVSVLSLVVLTTVEAPSVINVVLLDVDSVFVWVVVSFMRREYGTAKELSKTFKGYFR